MRFVTGAAGFALTLLLAVPALPSQWRFFAEPDFGASIRYPADTFERLPDQNGSTGAAFASFDGNARLVVAAWENSGETPGTFKDRLLSGGEYGDLTYEPNGRSWFVLSGYRGDEIYYEKVMYTCGRRLVNAFAITYPVAERAIYDPMVERLEDSFRPARNCP